VRRLKRWLSEDAVARLHERDRVTLARAMEKSKALSTIYAMRQELNVLWERSTESSEQLLARLQDWCRRAENRASRRSPNSRCSSSVTPSATSSARRARRSRAFCCPITQ